MLLPSPAALNKGYGGEKNEEQADNLGNSEAGEHEAIRPQAFDPEPAEGIQHEIGEKHIAPHYTPPPSEPE